jgi:hypothetical protein
MMEYKWDTAKLLLIRKVHRWFGWATILIANAATMTGIWIFRQNPIWNIHYAWEWFHFFGLAFILIGMELAYR